MITITEKVSELQVVKMLGLTPEEYQQSALKKVQELDLCDSEFPEMIIACAVLTDRLYELYAMDIISKNFGSNKEIEKVRGLFTDTFDVRRLKDETARQIKARHSATILCPYNALVGVLGEVYLYDLSKQYSESDINKLDRDFANDFYKISGEYLLENGIYDFNARIQTRRLTVDGVVQLVDKEREVARQLVKKGI